MTLNIAYSPAFFIRKVQSLPLWLRAPAEHTGTPAAVNEIISIPNSGHQAKGDLANGLQPAYLADDLGFNTPYPIVQNSSGTYDSTVYQGDANNPATKPLMANKYSYQTVGNSYATQDFFVAHQTYCGVALDSGVYSGRPANILAPGVGDSHWRDNTLHRFVFGVDYPFYEVAIWGTSYLNSKVTNLFGGVDNTCWTLPLTGISPAPGGTFIGQWGVVYQLLDHAMYQWTGTSAGSGAWQAVPLVDCNTSAETHTSVTPTGNELPVNVNASTYNTGTAVGVYVIFGSAFTGNLTSIVANQAVAYAVRISDTSIRLATTKALALASAPDITVGGTGSYTLIPLPVVGTNGSWLRTKGFNYNDPYWRKIQAVSGFWRDTSSGSWNTSEIDQIDATARTEDYRSSRHYDGSPRGGHTYTGYHCWERDHLFIRVGVNTAFPVDAGAFDDMCVGDLMTKKWIGVADGDRPEAPMWPLFKSVNEQPEASQQWKQKHPTTDDVWCVSNKTMIVLRHATVLWQIWWADTVAWQNGIFDLATEVVGGHTSGSDYAFGRGGPGAGLGFWWMYLQGADKVRKDITTVTGHPELLPTVTGTLATQPHYHGILWNPDAQVHMYFANATTLTANPLVSITLVNATTVDIQPYTLVGSATFTRHDGGEGMQSNWVFNRGYPRGIFYRPIDGATCQFMRTS